MAKFILLYRAGNTYKKTYSEERQDEISKKWGEWIKYIGEKYIESSPITRKGCLVSMDSTSEIVIDKSLINGYVIFSADSLEQAVDICRQCPLFHEGKTMELRELPNNVC